VIARADELLTLSRDDLAVAVLTYAMQTNKWPRNQSGAVRFEVRGEDDSGEPVVAAHVGLIYTAKDCWRAAGVNTDDDEAAEEQTSEMKVAAILSAVQTHLTKNELELLAHDLCGSLLEEAGQ
jgi:hypothetical protein